ncbi:hypothetical protein A9Q98_08325 [Thalassotalea sp. 42_200_T64]|nr:hypothetical protein A9Q98_08325 [Thalassotalea sp. 42_200_T64]
MKSSITLFITVALSLTMSVFVCAKAATTTDKKLQQLKSDLVSLNKDIHLLKEQLLFPDSTRLSLYVSLAVNQNFSLHSVKVFVDDDEVIRKDFTDRQVNALEQGGIHRLYVGNVSAGEHTLTAFFTGVDEESRTYKRGITKTIMKKGIAKVIELKINNNKDPSQVEFDLIEL